VSKSHRIEVALDDHCYEAVASEAGRLGVPVEQLVERAIAAWINEMAEASADCAPEVALVR
jgi:hypothetical protein